MALRVAIIGPGALGRALGACLERGGAEVSHVGRAPTTAKGSDPRHVATLVGGRLQPAPAPEGSTDPDLAIVTVKAYDTAAAARQHAALLRASGAVLSLQNGLGNVEAIEAAGVDPARILGGSTTHAARRLPGGEVIHVAEGETRLAPLRAEGAPVAEAVAARLSAHGVPTSVEADLGPLLWRKVAVSCAINGLTALRGYENGGLLGDEDDLARALAAAREALEVARDLGIPLDPAEAGPLVRSVAERTARNRSSMLQDRDAGRPSEIEAIHGAVVRAARDRLGRDAPLNRALLAELRPILTPKSETSTVHA